MLSGLVSAFNLIYDVDVPQAEARIAAFRAENAALIELNVQREEQYAQALREQEEAERRDRELRAEEARREEEEEREEWEKGRREIIDRLETSNKDAEKVIAQFPPNAIKRSSARLAATTATSHAQLLRSRAAQSTEFPDVPHVPLQDDWYAYEDMFMVRASYNDPFSEAVRQDPEGIMRGGGYRVEEAWERALRSAVSGLNVPPLVAMDPLSNKSGEPFMVTS